MGKKKRGHPDVEEVLGRPWCYYCERDFDDLKILISHQKAKHFKCDSCGRRLNTAGGLSVHLTQVHKETLASVENALPNRSNLDVEIFGMEGIPDDVMMAHNQRVIAQFKQVEAERRSATGNPAPGGGGGGNASKKPKFESPSDLKKRLAEHKAKMAEERAGGSGGGTPNGFASGGQSPGIGHSPGPYAQPPPQFGQGYGPYGQATSQSPFQPPPPQGHSPYQTFQPSLPFPPQSVPSPPVPLPQSAGLPQRPTFGAPPVDQFQMQQMHHTQSQQPPSMHFNTGAPPARVNPDTQAIFAKSIGSGSLDPPNVAAKNIVAGDKIGEKKGKKEKGTKLVYSDAEFSPEERRASLTRYAYNSGRNLQRA
ncbi:MAG: hypothetical protein M1814_002705 [Vezdaea aestivalis]|nr:MAG: hypothetical protein M1814_002705 [Vezdaea aestivalis]